MVNGLVTSIYIPPLKNVSRKKAPPPPSLKKCVLDKSPPDKSP